MSEEISLHGKVLLRNYSKHDSHLRPDYKFVRSGGEVEGGCV